MFRALARWILRDELQEAREKATSNAFGANLFFAWRRAALLWERYGREIQDRHPQDPTFEEFFDALPPHERINPEYVVEKRRRGRVTSPLPYR